jgi:hypothetical protein
VTSTSRWHTAKSIGDLPFRSQPCLVNAAALSLLGRLTPDSNPSNHGPAHVYSGACWQETTAHVTKVGW